MFCTGNCVHDHHLPPSVKLIPPTYQSPQLLPPLLPPPSKPQTLPPQYEHHLSTLAIKANMLHCCCVKPDPHVKVLPIPPRLFLVQQTLPLPLLTSTSRGAVSYLLAGPVSDILSHWATKQVWNESMRLFFWNGLFHLIWKISTLVSTAEFKYKSSQ